MKQQEDEKKKEALATQQAKKDKMMKLRILQSKMKAVRGGAEISASHEMQGDTIAEGEKEKEGDEDPRSMGTKIRLAKNKLRSMGLKMSYDMEGEMTEGLSVAQQMKISQDYNRMSPEEKKAANKKAMGSVKKVTPKKDTRTDAQKMTDATGPRPGSRYRGD